MDRKCSWSRIIGLDLSKATFKGCILSGEGFTDRKNFSGEMKQDESGFIIIPQMLTILFYPKQKCSRWNIIFFSKRDGTDIRFCFFPDKSSYITYFFIFFVMPTDSFLIN